MVTLLHIVINPVVVESLNLRLQSTIRLEVNILKMQAGRLEVRLTPAAGRVCFSPQ